MLIFNLAYTFFIIFVEKSKFLKMLFWQMCTFVHACGQEILLWIISWVIFNHARPTYEIITNIKSNHALESSHGETAMTG